MTEMTEMQARIFDLERLGDHVWNALEEDLLGTVRYDWTVHQRAMLIHLYGTIRHAIGSLDAHCELCPASQWSKVEVEYHEHCRLINISLDYFQRGFDSPLPVSKD
jgi:hypothetical protein